MLTPSTSWLLIATAAGLGFLHTLIGIDHSLPFVVLARSQRWRWRKLLSVTAVCGLAHVASSVAIGVLGILAGVALGKLHWLEATRGAWAARLLIRLGLAYAVWGIYRSRRDREHTHVHAHHDGTVHHHEHDHHGDHLHAHIEAGRAASERTRVMTVIGLMLVFVLGPCEALIPLLVAPAYDGQWWTVAGVVTAFGATTVATMLGMVSLGYWGMNWRGFASLERHLHTLAGLAIAGSGLAIELLGI